MRKLLPLAAAAFLAAPLLAGPPVPKRPLCPVAKAPPREARPPAPCAKRAIPPLFDPTPMFLVSTDGAKPAPSDLI